MLRDVIPSHASASIFFNGYLLSPASLSERSYVNEGVNFNDYEEGIKEAAGDENTVQENTASESTDTTEEKQAFLDAGRFHDLKDGICTGTADAFRGDVEVQVTVENQKVTDISILSYCDTEEYFFRAAPYVIGQMKEEQSLNIDALSGATYSSNGIIHATANALEIPEDEYAPRPGRDLAHKQKSKC